MLKYTLVRYSADTQVLRLPCTFRGGFSLTDVAPFSYITDTQNPNQIKAYRTGYSNISLLFQENKFLGFRNLKVQSVVQEFQLNAIFILIFGSLFFSPD